MYRPVGLARLHHQLYELNWTGGSGSAAHHRLTGRMYSCAIVVIFSYLPEILALSDRILVARQGRMVDEMDISEATQKLCTPPSIEVFRMTAFSR